MMNVLPSSGVTTLEKRAENGVDLDTTEKRNWVGLTGERDEEKAKGEVVDDVEEVDVVDVADDEEKRDGNGEDVVDDAPCMGFAGDEGDEGDEGEAETAGSSLDGREKGRPRLTFLSAEGGNRRLATDGWPSSSPTHR
jgi:hypothetical protein